jgi:WD40 repeat protein
MTKIFLSYRRQDTQQIVGRIFDRLVAKFGADAVFMDIDRIPFGVDFHDYISAQVGQAKTVLAVIGQGWIDARDEAGNRRLDNPDDFVRIEIEAALKRGIPLGAVLIDGAPMPRPEQLPETMRPLCRRNAAQVSSARDFHVHMDRLIADLERHLNGVFRDEPAAVAAGRVPPQSAAASTVVMDYENAAQRLIRSFTGHTGTGWVSSVAFAPDGRTALSGSADNTIKLWDVATGREIRRFAGHRSLVFSVSFAPDGRTALSGSADKTLKLWDVATGREIQRFTGHSDVVHSVAFAPDGRTALSGSADKTLKLWEVASGRELRSFTGHSDWVHSVAFAPSGRTALSGSYDNTIKLWDVATGRILRTFTGHKAQVLSVAFAPDGRSALSGSQDKTLKLWDVATGRELRSFTGHWNSVTSVAFAPDGRTALSGSDNKTIKLWDVSEWTQR